MSHTKGPWRIRINRNDDQDTCDMSICGDIFILADINGPQYEHQKANARLIAAAPDLLEALQGAIGALEFSREYHSDLGNEDQDFAQSKLDLAIAAIAKATQP